MNGFESKQAFPGIGEHNGIPFHIPLKEHILCLGQNDLIAADFVPNCSIGPMGFAVVQYQSMNVFLSIRTNFQVVPAECPVNASVPGNDSVLHICHIAGFELFPQGLKQILPVLRMDQLNQPVVVYLL